MTVKIKTSKRLDIHREKWDLSITVFQIVEFFLNETANIRCVKIIKLEILNIDIPP